MSKWTIAAKRADFNEIANKYGISPVLARLIRNRDVITDEEIDMYLNGDINNLHDPRSMMDLVKACSLIQQYISEGKNFRIIGDYDIDGVCATYILMKGLEKCGADVDYAIPHRIQDGYGLNENLIDDAHNQNRDVIITCDNGIAASSAIAHAIELGMHVIVTDHHEVPFEEDDETGERIELLPSAEAIVDPKRDGDNYPFSGICGAVVAWKLISVLLPMCGVGVDESEELKDSLLEEAALATVGDVMELRNENRIIVKEGLQRMMHTNNIGLKSLIRATELSGKIITAYHVGFIIGPCLNASGRLDTAARALELLLCEDEVQAAQMANELKNLNVTRKSMTEQGVALAVEDIENSTIGNDRVLVLYLPGIHESIAGIIAGRIRERYEKPVIVMTDTLEGIKGSGRSIEAYDMFEELSKHKELYTKFGGHKMAAGLSMDMDNLEIFRRELNNSCTLRDEDLVTKVVIDQELPLGYITYSFIEELSMLEPFGNGNTKPVFAIRGLKVRKISIIGKNRNLLLVKVDDCANGGSYELKLFNKVDQFLNDADEFYGQGTAGDMSDGTVSGVTVDIIYYPSINEYMGRRSLEFIVNDYRFK